MPYLSTRPGGRPARFLFLWLIAASLLLPTSLTAAPEGLDVVQAKLAAKLPRLAAQIQQRRPVHLAFVGDPLLLKEGPETMVGAFLRQLEEAFFYTGGTYNIYDPTHLEEGRPKITYECRPTAVSDPGVFHLMQYLTTEGLLNEPDLVILCAGPGDAAAGLDLTTFVRGFEKLRGLAQARDAEIMAVAPRAFVFEKEAALALQLETRAYALALQAWAEEEKVPFFDPNPALFPRAVLFHPEDDAQAIWDAFLSESLDWIQGRDQPPGTLHAPRQQALGRALFRSVLEPETTPRYRVSTSLSQANLSVTLRNLTQQPLGGLIVPAIASGQRGGMRFPASAGPAAFQIDLPKDPALTFRTQMPLSLIVIDDRQVQWVNHMAPVAPVGVEWLVHAHHNNLGSVPVKAQLFPYADAPQRLPYTLSFGDQEMKGTATFIDGLPAQIDWAVRLPDDVESMTFRETLILRLGENGDMGRFERRLDAIRQFALGTPVPLQWVASSDQSVPPTESDDPLTIGQPEATLTVEASKTDFTIHVDLKNFELQDAGDSPTSAPPSPSPSPSPPPALQVDLALDARSFDKRQTLGYTGVLFITAGPDDGPAAVSPFASRAHFGNGYARRPLVPGLLARLSTLPNGVRRLTIQMTPGYFYLHPWELGNFNSQLGIGLSLAIAQADGRPPLHYVLQETPRYPHNAEDLALVELADKGSHRWCVKWTP